MTNVFKKGDKVRCIINPGSSSNGAVFEVGGIYTVAEYDDAFGLNKDAQVMISLEGFGRGGHYASYFELVEEGFSKASLKTGMRVVSREGTVYIVLLDMGTIVGENGYDSIHAYTNTLETHIGFEKLDIVEVYAAPSPIDTLNVKAKGALLWQRTSPEQKRIAEIDSLVQELYAERSLLLERV